LGSTLSADPTQSRLTYETPTGTILTIDLYGNLVVPRFNLIYESTDCTGQAYLDDYTAMDGEAVALEGATQGDPLYRVATPPQTAVMVRSERQAGNTCVQFSQYPDTLYRIDQIGQIPPAVAVPLSLR
jgi:hypothetical protein